MQHTTHTKNTHLHNIYKIVTTSNTHTTQSHTHTAHTKHTHNKHNPSSTHTQHTHSHNTHIQVSMLKCFHVKSSRDAGRQGQPSRRRWMKWKPGDLGAGVSQLSHRRTTLRVPSSHRSPHRGLMNGLWPSEWFTAKISGSALITELLPRCSRFCPCQGREGALNAWHFGKVTVTLCNCVTGSPFQKLVWRSDLKH